MIGVRAPNQHRRRIAPIGPRLILISDLATYSGPTTALTDVWRALRASMRSVLEETHG